MKRPPGRPPLDDSGTPSAAVSVKLKAADYDRIYRLAKEQRTSVSDVIRKRLMFTLTDHRSSSV